MDQRFTKEQCEAIEKILKSYGLRPGTFINGHDMGRHYSNIKSYLDAQLLIQNKGLKTCPECNLDVMKIPGLCSCLFCGMIGQGYWGG